MVNTFRCLLIYAGCLYAQSGSFETVLELGLGQVLASQPDQGDPSRPRMLEISRIETAVVFRRMPSLGICPTGRQGNFDLRRLNSPGARAVTEHIGSICSVIDSVTVDTNGVYEIPTSSGKRFYLRPLARAGTGLKVRISPEMPPGTVPDSPIPGEPMEHPEVLLDVGQSIDGNFPYMMVSLSRLPSYAVLTFLDFQSGCSGTKRWDFELGKANPDPSRFPITRDGFEGCQGSDSVRVDSALIYEHYTAEGRLYYLRMLHWDGEKMRSRLETERPVSLRLRANAGNPEKAGPAATRRYRADGKRARVGRNPANLP